jgi:hypothetical protein
VRFFLALFFFSVAVGAGTSTVGLAHEGCCSADHAPQELQHRIEFLRLALSPEATVLFQSSEAQAIGVILKSLIEVYPEALQKLTLEELVARKSLALRLDGAIKAWAATLPRKPSAAVKWVTDFVKSAAHMALELPPEILARSYRGYLEFGALYLAVVLPTYPPWFIASETIEHAVLTAPIGAACTYLQLGYFLVIGSLMAPPAMLCGYAWSDDTNRSWAYRLGSMDDNVVRAFKDYIKVRSRRRDTLLEVKPELRRTNWFDLVEGAPKDLAKDRDLWSILLQPDQKPDEEVATWRLYVMARFLLRQVGVAIKEARDAGALKFGAYLEALRSEATLASALRRDFIVAQKNNRPMDLSPHLVTMGQLLASLSETCAHALLAHKDQH